MTITRTKGFYIALLAFVVALFLRAYALSRDFIFVYDQGRDAIAVEALLNGKLTLIGPTTGLQGVFLGPLYYYFLAPFYFLGGGDPMVAAYAIVVLDSLLVLFLFIVGNRLGGKLMGVLAAFFYCFSSIQINYAKWLSNPSPLPFTALLMFFVLLIALTRRKALLFFAVGILLGACIQFEAANALFYLPTIVIIVCTENIIEYIHTKKRKYVNFLVRLFTEGVLVAAGFGIMLIPQFLFEVRHGFLSTRALIASFAAGNRVKLIPNLIPRANVLYALYTQAWFPNHPLLFGIVLVAVIIFVIIFYKQLFSKREFRLVFFWFVIPTFFELTYTGNQGNFWSYYVISQHLALYLLVAYVIAYAFGRMRRFRSSFKLGLVVLGIAFLITNYVPWKGVLTPYALRISLSEQEDAIRWIYAQSGTQPFGVWAYTPSYQDDVYRYLFSYFGKMKGIYPVQHPEHTHLMFLIVEDDIQHLARESAWIFEHEEIGKGIAHSRFGAIVVYEIERK